jgi:DNA-binding IclR family transcriptional regulator
MPSMAASSVLGKVRSILDALGDGGVLGLSELARRSGVAKPTVHRLCGELVDWGVVERSGDAFRLGPKLFELGGRVPGRRQLREAALPFVEDLFVATGQTIHLAVLDGLEVFYVERLTGRRFRPAPSAIADRLPLHCTATGKCLLAFGPPELLDAVIDGGLAGRTDRSITDGATLAEELARVRADGTATEIGEVSEGHVSVGAPIFELGEGVAGALSITGQEGAFDLEQCRTLVRVAAAGLSRRLGATERS